MSKAIKILIFTEGTIIMHKSAVGHTREEIAKQVEKEEQSIHDYGFYVPVGNAAKKIKKWVGDGAEVLYLTSLKRPQEIEKIKKVLKKHGFPECRLLFLKKNQKYKDVIESVIPDILIEDDCESIGGASEMTITHIKPELKKRIKSIAVKEFGGIDHLPDKVIDLINLV